ncbi:phage tail protein [Achromobacter denitrificans]|uniref:phage tail protein n=1 Tax=Achromobacter denitrificans TaxID=32002 RepID=UPI000B48D441|nr:phage tail protein [Achromobacter denitrificans]
MKQKTVYQTDSDGLFAYETFAYELALAPGVYNVPYGAYENAPPPAPAGMVPRGVDGQAWALVEDHRKDPLWVVGTGAPYVPHEVIELDGASASYPGWGAVPAWLTLVAPPRPVEDAEAGA